MAIYTRESIEDIVNQQKLRSAINEQMVIKMHLKSFTILDIAQSTGLTKPKIHDILTKFRGDIVTKNIKQREFQTAFEIEKINQLENEAWVQLEASMQPEITTEEDYTTKEGDEMGRGTSFEQRSSKTRTKNRTGNGSYMSIILNCIKARAELKGLYNQVIDDDDNMATLEEYMDDITDKDFTELDYSDQLNDFALLVDNHLAYSDV